MSDGGVRQALGQNQVQEFPIDPARTSTGRQGSRGWHFPQYLLGFVFGDHGKSMVTPNTGLIKYAGAVVRAAGQIAVRLLVVLVLASTGLIAAADWSPPRAEEAKGQIVGLGAATCQQFADDVRSNPIIRRDYLAWAQGFMSGILLGRPPGVDTGLNLNPASFGLLNQLQFLENYCARNASVDFAEAVEALYKRLRQEGKT